MNSRQMQYAILLSEIRNFSQVAEKLNISQPALSKQVLSLEKELGVQLFDRSVNPIALTPAGELFIRDARELVYKEDQLHRSMERFRTGAQERLVIGVSPFRAQHLIPGIIKKLKMKYPGVQVCLHEPASDQIRKEAAEGKYDFAIVNLPVDESNLDVIPMNQETLVLAVPERLLDKLPKVSEGALPEIELTDCEKLPFITAMQTLEMRRHFDRLLARAGIHPHIAVEVTGLTTAWAMVNAGLGAALLPLQMVDEQAHDGKVALFSIKDSVSFRQPVIVTRRGQYLSDSAKYAIDLLAGKK